MKEIKEMELGVYNEKLTKVWGEHASEIKSKLFFALSIDIKDGKYYTFYNTEISNQQIIDILKTTIVQLELESIDKPAINE